jgi:putative endonuclease
MKKYSVYIVECKDGTLYTGISNDVVKRVKNHNNGSGAKYTKTRLPVTLIYEMVCGDKSEALKIEYKIKQLSRSEKLNLCLKQCLPTDVSM